MAVDVPVNPLVVPDRGGAPSEFTRPPRTARRAVTLIFLINGVILSNWVPRIPAVQSQLDLSEGQLGVALIGPAIGAIVAMPATGWLIARFGSRPITTIAVTLLALSLVLPALAVSLATLTLSLVCLGAANGSLDVAMNAQGVAVERQYSRPILSSFHAAFSLGGLIGAGTAGVIAAFGVAVFPHFLSIAVVMAIAALFVSRQLLPAGVDRIGPRVKPAIPIARRRTWRRLPRPLALLGVVGFCCLVGEGAMADWTAVYLTNVQGTGEGLAAAGFAAFSGMMFLGRLIGDRLTGIWGPVAIARRGGIVVAVALAAALLADHPWAAIIGFGAVGAGLACIVPVVFSAAGRTSSMPPGPAIAVVSTMSYAGFLAGPPLIGFAAELTNLGIALGFVVFMGVAIALMAGTVGGERDPADADADARVS